MKRKLLALLLALTAVFGSVCHVACQQYSDTVPPLGNNDPNDPNAPSTPGGGEGNEIAAGVTGSMAAFNNLATSITNKRAELLTPLDNDYRSRTEVTYDNINGKTVTAYTLMVDYGEGFFNNPNFAQAVMIYQAMRYKDKHPEENVQITITSFHFSVYLAACLDESSPDYGKMICLYDAEYNDRGYYRLSYLLVEAAKKGIEVTVIGQIDASGVTQEDGSWRADASFWIFFADSQWQPAYISGKTVGDFMTFRVAHWTSYGDKSAADMMHNKTCTVSHYIDNDGVEHKDAIWVGSINLDGISGTGMNGNNSVQTGLVVTNHAELRRVIYNYTRLMTNYCEQEEISLFREAVITANTKQIELLRTGRGNEIPAGEQIVYIGTENDSVFELYFTPLGGDFSTWDTLYNPYSKYLSKLLPSVSGESYIELLWNNVKFNTNFDLSTIFIDVIKTAFLENGNLQNRLHLHLPGLDGNVFSELVNGENIGQSDINNYVVYYHTKDLQLSYQEEGERYYVTILNSLNFHEGSMYHQSNTILVIKETAETGNDLYTDYAILTTPGMDFESYRITD